MDSTELQEFLAESRDLIAQAESSLIRLETNASFATEYDAVFRAFHTIKGMAGMLEQFELQKHVHLIESMLTTIKGIEVVPRSYIDFFLRACDATTRLLNGESIEFNYTVEGAAAPGAAKEAPTRGMVKEAPARAAVDTTEAHEQAPAFEAVSPSAVAEAVTPPAVHASDAAPVAPVPVAAAQAEAPAAPAQETSAAQSTVGHTDAAAPAPAFDSSTIPEVKDSPELAWKTVELLAKASLEANANTPKRAADADALEFLAESEDSLQNLY